MMQRPITYGSRQAPDPFDQFLEAHSFYRKHTARDSTCLFRVISEQMYDTQILHQEVRKECVRYMTLNKNIFMKYVNTDYDKYLEEMTNLKTTGSLLELRALGYLYKRNVIIFQPFNLGKKFVFNSNFHADFRVFYTSDQHFDSIFEHEFVKDAALCQSLVYDWLYRMYFKLPDVKYAVEHMLHPSSFENNRFQKHYDGNGFLVDVTSEDGCKIKLDLPHITKCILLNYMQCSFHCNSNIKNDSKEIMHVDISLPETGKTAPEDVNNNNSDNNLLLPYRFVSCVRQLLNDGITPFPYKVAKSLDPKMYRNSEFDSWSDSRKFAKRNLLYMGDYNFQVGAKCYVNLPQFEGKQYSCHIQEINDDISKFLVHVEELGVKYLVDLEALTPLPTSEFQPWELPYTQQRALQRKHFYSTKIRPNLRTYLQKINYKITPNGIKANKYLHIKEPSSRAENNTANPLTNINNNFETGRGICSEIDQLHNHNSTNENVNLYNENDAAKQQLTNRDTVNNINNCKIPPCTTCNETISPPNHTNYVRRVSHCQSTHVNKRCSLRQGYIQSEVNGTHYFIPITYGYNPLKQQPNQPLKKKLPSPRSPLQQRLLQQKIPSPKSPLQQRLLQLELPSPQSPLQQRVLHQPVLQQPPMQNSALQRLTFQQPPLQQPALQQPSSLRSAIQQPPKQQLLLRRPLRQAPKSQSPLQQPESQLLTMHQTAMQQPRLQQVAFQQPAMKKRALQRTPFQRTALQKLTKRRPPLLSPPMQRQKMQQLPMQWPSLQRPPIQQPALYRPAIQHPPIQRPLMQQPALQQQKMQRPTMHQSALQQPGIQSPPIIFGTQSNMNSERKIFDANSKVRKNSITTPSTMSRIIRSNNRESVLSSNIGVHCSNNNTIERAPIGRTYAFNELTQLEINSDISGLQMHNKRGLSLDMPQDIYQDLRSPRYLNVCGVDYSRRNTSQLSTISTRKQT